MGADVLTSETRQQQKEEHAKFLNISALNNFNHIIQNALLRDYLTPLPNFFTKYMQEPTQAPSGQNQKHTEQIETELEDNSVKSQVNFQDLMKSVELEEKVASWIYEAIENQVDVGTWFQNITGHPSDSSSKLAEAEDTALSKLAEAEDAARQSSPMVKSIEIKYNQPVSIFPGTLSSFVGAVSDFATGFTPRLSDMLKFELHSQDYCQTYDDVLRIRYSKSASQIQEQFPITKNIKMNQKTHENTHQTIQTAYVIFFIQFISNIINQTEKNLDGYDLWNLISYLHTLNYEFEYTGDHFKFKQILKGTIKDTFNFELIWERLLQCNRDSAGSLIEVLLFWFYLWTDKIPSEMVLGQIFSLPMLKQDAKDIKFLYKYMFQGFRAFLKNEAVAKLSKITTDEYLRNIAEEPYLNTSKVDLPLSKVQLSELFVLNQTGQETTFKDIQDYTTMPYQYCLNLTKSIQFCHLRDIIVPWSENQKFLIMSVPILNKKIVESSMKKHSNYEKSHKNWLILHRTLIKNNKLDADMKITESVTYGDKKYICRCEKYPDNNYISHLEKLVQFHEKHKELLQNYNSFKVFVTPFLPKESKLPEIYPVQLFEENSDKIQRLVLTSAVKINTPEDWYKTRILSSLSTLLNLQKTMKSTICYVHRNEHSWYSSGTREVISQVSPSYNIVSKEQDQSCKLSLELSLNYNWSRYVKKLVSLSENDLMKVFSMLEYRKADLSEILQALLHYKNNQTALNKTEIETSMRRFFFKNSEIQELLNRILHFAQFSETFYISNVERPGFSIVLQEILQMSRSAKNMTFCLEKKSTGWEWESKQILNGDESFSNYVNKLLQYTEESRKLFSKIETGSTFLVVGLDVKQKELKDVVIKIDGEQSAKQCGLNDVTEILPSDVRGSGALFNTNSASPILNTQCMNLNSRMQLYCIPDSNEVYVGYLPIY